MDERAARVSFGCDCRAALATTNELIVKPLIHSRFNPLKSYQPLNFTSYPLRPASYAATLGRTVIVVPHPDDEALGCGGLLALLRQAGQPVAAALVSDGTMSHPASREFSAVARRELRYAELRHALAVLAVDENNVLYLGLPDSQVPSAGPAFEAAAARLADFFAQQQAETVLVPWRRDPHPDHRASSELTSAALARLPTHPPAAWSTWCGPGSAPRPKTCPGPMRGPAFGSTLGRCWPGSSAPLRPTARSSHRVVSPTTLMGFYSPKRCWPISTSPLRFLLKPPPHEYQPA